MSYLTRFMTPRPARKREARVDERTLLNYPEFDGGAAALGRMWRNRLTHRSQKPAAARP